MKSVQQYILENGLAVTVSLAVALPIINRTYNAGAIVERALIYSVIFILLAWLIVYELNAFTKSIGKSLAALTLVIGTFTLFSFVISEIVLKLFMQEPFMAEPSTAASAVLIFWVWVLSMFFSVVILWLRNFNQARKILGS